MVREQWSIPPEEASKKFAEILRIIENGEPVPDLGEEELRALKDEPYLNKKKKEIQKDDESGMWKGLRDIRPEDAEKMERFQD